ncbi:hypothetical protein V1289_003680 [Bradyrhizobium sp. AZCC 2289]
MQRSQISQLIQMGSIGTSDTTSADSPCHPGEMALSNVIVRGCDGREVFLNVDK